MVNGKTKDANRLEASRIVRVNVLAFAKHRGSLGFTVDQLHAELGGNADVLRSRLNALRIAGRIVKLPGNEMNKFGTAKVSRYKYKEPVADEVLENAAKVYKETHPTTSATKYANVQACILAVGHDEDFEPRTANKATGELAGTAEKMNVLASRVLRGESLWHPLDAVGYHARCEPME